LLNVKKIFKLASFLESATISSSRIKEGRRKRFIYVNSDPAPNLDSRGQATLREKSTKNVV
jgi:hypothetical protein